VTLGLEMYPRDMAKIGLLVLNNGNWNGEQIVPEEWIIASTKPYVAESEFFDYRISMVVQIKKQ
jgi:CubicO group peptidase (beta-lactamase class C family)